MYLSRSQLETRVRYSSHSASFPAMYWLETCWPRVSITRRTVAKLRLDLVVCGFKLTDESCETLYFDLPQRCAMLMVAPQAQQPRAVVHAPLLEPSVGLRFRHAVLFHQQCFGLRHQLLFLLAAPASGAPC